MVAREDIQIPTRKAVSCEGRILHVEVEGEIHRVAPVRKYEDSEEGITLCESVVKWREMIPGVFFFFSFQKRMLKAPGLTWAQMKEELQAEYAGEPSAPEAMRTLADVRQKE